MASAEFTNLSHSYFPLSLSLLPLPTATSVGSLLILLLLLLTLVLPLTLQRLAIISAPSEESDRFRMRHFGMTISSILAIVCPNLLYGEMVGLKDLLPTGGAHLRATWWWPGTCIVSFLLYFIIYFLFIHVCFLPSLPLSRLLVPPHRHPKRTHLGCRRSV